MSLYPMLNLIHKAEALSFNGRSYPECIPFLSTQVFLNDIIAHNLVHYNILAFP